MSTPGPASGPASKSAEGGREGSLEAPTRHPLDWRNPEFYDEAALDKELERVFDICHGCRRCFSLCNSFPTLFDAIDESPTLELDGVDKKVYWDVVDNCYLCDMCYMTKCPYVPPHPWNIDFPHLMLRAKATHNRKERPSFRDRTLSNTDLVGKLAGIPVVAEVVNAVNRTSVGRVLLEKTLGVAKDAPLPTFHTRTARNRLWSLGTVADAGSPASEIRPTEQTTGKVALFTTCYGNRNEPELAEDLAAVLEHNGVKVVLIAQERCCGMPKLEHGDLETVARLKEFNIPQLLQAVDVGLRHRGADSILRVDVQAGAAADVSRRSGRHGGQGAHLRSVRIPDVAPQGRVAAHRLQDIARQDQLSRGMSLTRAEHRAQDTRCAQARARYHG